MDISVVTKRISVFERGAFDSDEPYPLSRTSLFSL